jgi:hypothetical protein
LNEVNSAINQMDQVTQQNAAMVEQSTAASHALAQEATELSRLVAQFKVDTAPGKPANDVSRQGQPRQTHRPAVAGNTALAMQAQLKDEWEAF